MAQIEVYSIIIFLPLFNKRQKYFIIIILFKNVYGQTSFNIFKVEKGHHHYLLHHSDHSSMNGTVMYVTGHSFGKKESKKLNRNNTVNKLNKLRYF